MTNKEWLMTLDGKELAKKIDDFNCFMCAFHNDGDGSCGSGNRPCVKGIELWLKQEHKEQ